MPFANDNDETFPCGIAVNLNSTLVITEGNLNASSRSLNQIERTHCASLNFIGI